MQNTKKYILSLNGNSLPGTRVDFNYFVFNGGEPHFELKTELFIDSEVMIFQRIKSFNDVGRLLVAVDAIKRAGIKNIKLTLPYFPGARQDRVMAYGQALTVKVYADIINSLSLSEVTIYDPHSDVTPVLINNCRVINNHRFITNALEQIDGDYIPGMRGGYLISPDAGSNKKVNKLSQHIEAGIIRYCEKNNIPYKPLWQIINCDKTRDVMTGNLSGFKVYADDLKGNTCVLVDDICDGGGTFIGLAKELKEKNAGDLILAVSHGVFSNGLKQLGDCFHMIYTTDSFYDPGYEFLERNRNYLHKIKIIHESIT